MGSEAANFLGGFGVSDRRSTPRPLPTAAPPLSDLPEEPPLPGPSTIWNVPKSCIEKASFTYFFFLL